MGCDQYSPQWGKKLLHEVVREGSPVKAMSRLSPTMFPSRQGVGSEFWTEQRYFAKTGRWGHPGELGGRKYFGGARVVVRDAGLAAQLRGARGPSLEATVASTDTSGVLFGYR